MLRVARPNHYFSTWNLKHALRSAGAGIMQMIVLAIGVVLAALGFALFQVPHNIAAGGVGGIAIIVQAYSGWPVGMTYFVLNLPLLLLGFFYLGRWRFVIQTLIAATLFSVVTDALDRWLPAFVEQWPLTDDLLLSAIYAGIIGGIGGGLIYRGGATMGGTGIVSRIIQNKTGIPLSTLYLYVDGSIVALAGIVFGWELALYAMLTLFLSGMASDYVLEGPSRARTATIITESPEIVGKALSDRLGHGITHWEVTGGHTQTPRTLIMCTFYRPQLAEMKRAISEADPEAFVSIGVTQQAIGRGFTRKHGA